MKLAHFVRTKLIVDNLDSPSQVLIVQSLLREKPGVLRVLAHLKTKQVYVDHGPATTIDDCLSTLKQMGFLARSQNDAHQDDEDSHPENNAATVDANDAAHANGQAVRNGGVGVGVGMGYGIRTAGSNHDDLPLVRSQFYVRGICCATECPAVNKICKSLPGVVKVQINIATKNVYVEYYPNLIQASDISSTLTRQGFDSRILKDGGKALLVNPAGAPSSFSSSASAAGGAPGASSTSTSTPSNTTRAEVGRTTLHMTKVLNWGDINKIHKVLAPLPGVIRVGVNVAESVVFVQHDVTVITAQQCSVLLRDSYAYPSHRRSYHRQQQQKQRQQKQTTNKLNGTSTPNTAPTTPTTTPVNDGRDPSTAASVAADREAAAAAAAVVVEHVYSNTIAADAADEIAQRATTALTLARSKYVESTLVVSNLTTFGHVRLLEKVFRQNYIQAQLRAFYPHLVSKTIKLEHNPALLQAQDVVTLLQRFGMDATVAVDGSVENLALPLLEDYQPSSAVQDDANGNGSGRGGDTAPPLMSSNGAAGGMDAAHSSATLHVNVILSGVFWFLSILSYLGGQWRFLEYAGLMSVLFGIPPIAHKAWRTVRRCQFDANCMMVIAALGALGLQEYDEAASVAFLFAVSEYLETRATDRARKALQAIVTLRPDHANVVHPLTKEIVIVPAERVPVGSLICVKTGDKIASDGIVTDGVSSVDESSLTGEAVPVTKRSGDRVSGGSINIGDSQLIVKTTTSVEDSAVSRLIRLVEEAQSNRSPTEKLVDSFAKTYTPAVFFLAAVLCTVPWFWGTDVGRYWMLNGLIIIVIACPCALTISTPVTYAAGLAAAAQRGVIVKGGARLEALGSVRKVLFDKTGTLTTGKFTLTHLETFHPTTLAGTGGEKNDKDKNPMARDEILGLLAMVQAPSSHPLSSTLVKAVRKEGISIPKDKVMTDHTVLKGEGVMATIDGEKVYVGNKRLFTRLRLYDPRQPYQRMTDEWGRHGGTVGFIGKDGAGIVGAFCVTDAVREEAGDVVRQLHDEWGMDITMLTGDGHGAAGAVARQIGLPETAVHSQLLPEDKLHFVGSLIEKRPKAVGNEDDDDGKGSSSSCCAVFSGGARKKRLVLMCGDGINDAPALAVADVGVAMGEGAALAMEMSDITLMDGNLHKLVYVIRMGHRVLRTIRENIVLSLVTKIAVVVLTFAGKMTLLTAIAADVGIMLLVTLNGMKLLPSANEPTMMTTTTTTTSTTTTSSSTTTASPSAMGSPSRPPKQKRAGGKNVFQRQSQGRYGQVASAETSSASAATIPVAEMEIV